MLHSPPVLELTFMEILSPYHLNLLLLINLLLGCRCVTVAAAADRSFYPALHVYNACLDRRLTFCLGISVDGTVFFSNASSSLTSSNSCLRH